VAEAGEWIVWQTISRINTTIETMELTWVAIIKTSYPIYHAMEAECTLPVQVRMEYDMIEQPTTLTGSEGRILGSETVDRILKHNGMEPDEEHLMMIATQAIAA
jgi:hypothetical protein